MNVSWRWRRALQSTPQPTHLSPLTPSTLHKPGSDKNYGLIINKSSLLHLKDRVNQSTYRLNLNILKVLYSASHPRSLLGGHCPWLLLPCWSQTHGQHHWWLPAHHWRPELMGLITHECRGVGRWASSRLVPQSPGAPWHHDGICHPLRCRLDTYWWVLQWDAQCFVIHSQDCKTDEGSLLMFILIIWILCNT